MSTREEITVPVVVAVDETTCITAPITVLGGAYARANVADHTQPLRE